MPYPSLAVDHEVTQHASTGEEDLTVAMILLTLEDARAADTALRADVRRFLRNHSLEYWCDLLGLSEGMTACVREELERRLDAPPVHLGKAKRLMTRVLAQRTSRGRHRQYGRRRHGQRH